MRRACGRLAAALPAALPGTLPGAAVALVGLAGGARADLPVPDRDPGEVRRAVREVLGQPAYQHSGQPILLRLLSKLLEWLNRVLAAVGGGGGGWGTLLGLVLLGLILAAVGWALYRFGRGVTRDPELGAALALPPRRPAADWRAEAERHEAAGEWREAVRCRYRALVADLAARGLVDEVPGRTAGEYRGEVRRNAPTAAEDFAGVTELFERAWYGNRATGRDAAERAGLLAGRVLGRAGA